MKIRYLVLFCLLLVALPVQAQETVNFPELTGEYSVARKAIHLIDESREEIFTEEAGDMREVMITIHYPAASTSQPAPYADEAMEQAIGLPSGFLANFISHASADSPIAENEPSYPIILFSPGFGNLPLFYTSLLENLASHGYIVVSMSHTYSTSVTLFPDGRALTINEAGSIPFSPEMSPEEMDAGATALNGIWVTDALFVLDSLAELNKTEFSGKMDFSRVGMFGHSFGGAASAQAAYQDERILAAINMDGSMYGKVTQKGLEKPFMLMFSERITPSDEELEAAGYTREMFEADLAKMEADTALMLDAATPGYQFTLIGSAHNTYTTDFSLLSLGYPELAPESEIGAIEPLRAVEIINTYVVAFFDKHVKGMPVSLLDSASADYPEVEFEVHE